MPRHPPCALTHLTTNTHSDHGLQGINNHKPENHYDSCDPANPHPPNLTFTRHQPPDRDARVHCAVLNQQPDTPAPHHPPDPPHDGGMDDRTETLTRATHPPARQRRRLTPTPRTRNGPVPQDPTVRPTPTPTSSHPPHQHTPTTPDSRQQR
jgi:hypothetical protein